MTIVQYLVFSYVYFILFTLLLVYLFGRHNKVESETSVARKSSVFF